MAVKKATTKEKTPKKTAAKKVAKPVNKKVEKTEKGKTPKVVKKVNVPKTEIKKVVAPKAETKKEEKKIEKPAKLADKPSTLVNKYFYAVGRRKAASAQVRLFANDKATDNELIINGKKLKEYFPVVALQNNLLAPLKAVGMYGKFGMSVIVRGGGVTGQVEGIRLGIARALIKYDESFKKSLKSLGLMTRDSREVERKKAGLKKARKSPQWAKR